MFIDEYKTFFKTLAQQSGEILRRYFFNEPLTVERKADDSPVTQADREAEERLRQLIHKHYPDHGIIGEEFEDVNTAAEFVWSLDPIDGTISFTHGVPLFGTIISLLKDGKPLLGMIHQPIVNLLCIGDGKTTSINDKPVRMRPLSQLDKATLLTTDIENIRKYQNYDAFRRLYKRVHIMRTWGDCYGYLLLAAGKADIMLDPVMHQWDLLPLIPIIEGAGGAISAWNGSNIHGAESVVAAHSDWHQQIVEILNNA